MRVYHKLAKRLNIASATFQRSGTVRELTPIYELLADVSHELDARMKMMKANRSKDVASLFARKVGAAPFARKVKAAVDLSDDLSFLNKKSWCIRVNALRQRDRFVTMSDEG